MAMDLTSISGPSFLKSLDNEQLKDLSEDIRSFLIEKLSENLKERKKEKKDDSF